MSGEVRHKNQAASLIDNSFGFRRKRSQRLRKGEGVGEASGSNRADMEHPAGLKSPSHSQPSQSLLLERRQPIHQN